MNKIIISGRLGADPELKRTPSDIAVTSFSVAVNRMKDKNGNQTTDWIDCVAWRNNAEFITKYFSKGKMILIEGQLQTRTYQDKQGNNRKVTEVIVDRAEFCGDAGENTQKDNNKSSFTMPSGDSYEDDDFILIDDDEFLPF